jgi:hypothetical protein
MRVVATSEDIQAMKTYIEKNRFGDRRSTSSGSGDAGGRPGASGLDRTPVRTGGDHMVGGVAMDPPNEHDNLRARIRQGPPHLG